MDTEYTHLRNFKKIILTLHLCGISSNEMDETGAHYTE